ncbi:tRNA (adenosine(37)-N6)-threonylcarbamoyltransferase complex dimerization subunit type 1 TsaB [Mastigocoleus testarum]|uniref:tRNA threonylcarbamoyladenosine biosynthesis protein TsaB n=1 Tax=Mastigocoleus testarum BC008 TaxID=371196 RepID=A0A0V7ZZH5_9CYAN|nr:tRNA (adenosine(37)-N6)-threonylcarbamoyltransferase complex dimerization subunit type 1 TsaB [Mastigocoleus testarum]KST69929.1 tRNA threonylcarbamoyladenosine biosynthesis protein TsaB [Mastigocoleus testarum BC008]KST69954.1 tRNA threonylcarbamoyladenosine biosynthesis protein TsaB [Mastigocoleus testarum BC008]
MSRKQEHLQSKKYVLALHTTTPELGLAISNFDGGDKRSKVWNLERELSSQMHQCLIEFIKPQQWQDLAFIAVAKGPGGYTGTRIGMVTARTLGQQLDIPVFGISTLAAFAWHYLTNLELNKGKGEKTLAVQMPAQRGKLFTAIYQTTPNISPFKVLLPDTVLTPESWQEKLSKLNLNYQLLEANSELAKTVTSILDLAYIDWCKDKFPLWSEALPFYGQHPVDI